VQMSGCVDDACWGPTYASVVWSRRRRRRRRCSCGRRPQARRRCGIRSECSRGVTAWLHHGGGCKQTLPYPTLNLSRHWADGPHRRPAPQALEEALAPRLRLAGEGAALGSKQTLPHPTLKLSFCPAPQALEEALAPRLRLAGEGAALQRFGEFFQGRELEKGTEVVMLWRPEGAVELALRRAAGPELSQARRAAVSRWRAEL